VRRFLLLSVAALLAATGCMGDDADDKGLGDAPVATAASGKKAGDDSPATITNMPNHYGNLATKCVAGAKPWRVIEGTNTDSAPSNFILVQDPHTCGGDWVPGPRVVSSGGSKGVQPPDEEDG
jgi:hypothetical protein